MIPRDWLLVGISVITMFLGAGCSSQPKSLDAGQPIAGAAQGASETQPSWYAPGTSPRCRWRSVDRFRLIAEALSPAVRIAAKCSRCAIGGTVSKRSFALPLRRTLPLVETIFWSLCR